MSVKKFIYLFVLGLLFAAQSAPVKEYQVKAAFLFNFSQFVSWPPSSFNSPQAPMVIGVLGEDELGNFLEKMSAGESAGGHPLTIERYHSLDEIRICHILFINKAEIKKINNNINLLNQRKILTVSDGLDFIQKGGIVRLVTVNNKIQLQINPEAAKSSDLTISSKLLRLAEIVVPK